MKTRKSFSIVLALAAVVIGSVMAWAKANPAGSSGYQVVKTVPLPGDGFWDYVGVDSDARRIYVSHGTKVLVLDADSLAVVGQIPDTQGVHGIAVAPELGRGFTSNGRAGTSTIFDLKTQKMLGSVNTGKNPDAIAYEPVTKRIFTFNGGSNDATAFGAADGTVVGTIPLQGKPEFAAADGTGKIFVNIESTSELVEIDAQGLKILQRWPLSPCESPSGLSMDRKNRRLFVGCENKMMAVVNADNGKVIATPAIGQGVDATAFDPGTGFALASNGEGTLTVVKENGPDNFSVLDNVPTKRSARTMGLDLKTHTVVLPAADFLPPKEGERRGEMKPGSFVLVVVSR
ncbi:MAG TPA: YncE family protein [Candidatus Sulfotelmatobacter sp.]|nr:YncE family protein [Candidatus Sulfotelmatobacter sp.]